MGRATNGVGVDRQPASDVAGARPEARRRYIPVTADADTLLHPRAVRQLVARLLMRQGARVYYEPSAVAFTAAPTRLVHLARQRARWARA